MRRIALWTVIAGLLAAIALAADAPLGKIAYGVKEGERVLIHVMNADGTGDRVLPGQTATMNVFPAWSPDGKQLAFTTAEDPQSNQAGMAIINADGSELRTITLDLKFSAFVTWSPDGKTLLFMGAAEGGMPGVYSCDALGNSLTRHTPDDQTGFSPFWMPDGKRFGFVRMTNPQEETGAIVLVNRDGTGEEVLLEMTGFAFTGPGAVSPDGKKLIYVAFSPMDESMEIKILDLVTKADTALTDLEVEFQPAMGPEAFPLAAWSPDGKSFIASLKTGDGQALFRISADGKMRTRLTPEDVYATAGSWWWPPTE